MSFSPSKVAVLAGAALVLGPSASPLSAHFKQPSSQRQERKDRPASLQLPAARPLSGLQGRRTGSPSDEGALAPPQAGPFAFHRHVSLSGASSARLSPAVGPSSSLMASPISQVRWSHGSNAGTARSGPGADTERKDGDGGRVPTADAEASSSEASGELDALAAGFGDSPLPSGPAPGAPKAPTRRLAIPSQSMVAETGSPVVPAAATIQEAVYRNGNRAKRTLKFQSLHAESEVIWLAVKAIGQVDAEYQEAEMPDHGLAIAPGQMVRVRAVDPSDDLEFWIEDEEGAHCEDLALTTVVGD